jgi:pimeloyl-ACP methyl ester carboxylesterase
VPEVILRAAGGRVLRTSLRSSGLPGDIADDYAHEMVEGGNLTTALNWYRAIDLAATRVGDVSVPSTLVWGERDPFLGPAAARATERHMRGFYRFVPLRDAGHWIPECHADELARLIQEHLHRAVTV